MRTEATVIPPKLDRESTRLNLLFAITVLLTITASKAAVQPWNWKTVSTPSLGNGTLLDVDFSSQDNGIAVGSPGNILTSADGGLSWTKVNQSVTFSEIYSVAFASENVAIAVTGSNSIIRTTDRGATWQIVDSTYFHSPLSAIAFADSRDGFIIGDAIIDTVLRTTDGGLTWSVFSPIQSRSGYAGMAFADSLIGITMTNTKVLRTINAGATWIPIDYPFNYPFSVAFANSKIGLIVGPHQTVWRTADAGITWSMVYQDTASHSAIYHIAMSAGGAGIVSSIDSIAIITNDFGLNWKPIHIGIPYGAIWQAKFTKAGRSILVGDAVDTLGNGGVLVRISDIIQPTPILSSPRVGNLNSRHYPFLFPVQFEVSPNDRIWYNLSGRRVDMHYDQVIQSQQRIGK